MSLKKHFPEFAFARAQVDPSEIASYETYRVMSPSVTTSYIGTCNGTATTAQAMVLKTVYPDYPRNLAYSVTGVAGGQGGTWTVSGQDQFGGTQTETVAIATANGGGTNYGTMIFARVGGGTFTPLGLGGTAIGTAAVGVGSATGATGNWFGLPTRISGTQDVVQISWTTGGTAPALNGGTNIGTLVSGPNGTTPPHAFQGTAGITVGDSYVVTFKTTWDNSNYPSMTGLKTP